MVTMMTTVNAAVFGLCHNVVSSCHANLVDVRDIYIYISHGWLVAGNLGGKFLVVFLFIQFD